MKKAIFLGAVLLLTTSCWQRIGDLTMVSNRNIDKSEEYVLIERGVEATAKMKNDDALEVAIDKLVDEFGGEYLMNAKIYVMDNGKKIKVQGDVWGYPPKEPATNTD